MSGPPDATGTDTPTGAEPPDRPNTGPDGHIPVPETTVPAGETPAARCPYCDRPFATERPAALHVAEVHGDVCTDAEREAAIAARDDEDDELFVYHLKVVGALSLLYSMSVIGYMVVLGA